MVNGMIAFFKTVFTVLLKVTAWLLFTLGLWFPFVYAFVFLIVAAASGVNLMEQMRLFLTGLFLSAVAGCALSYYIADFKRKKRKAAKAKAKGKGYQSDVKNKQNAGTDDEYFAPESPKVFKREKDAAAVFVQRGRKEKRAVKNSAGVTSAAFDRVEPVSSVQERSACSSLAAAWGVPENGPYEKEPAEKEQDFKQAWRLGEADVAKFEQKYLNSATNIQESGLKSVDDEVKAKWDRIISEAQRPLVFRSKADPSVYIYEFVDCFHFYRRAGDEMEYIGARAKGI